MDVIADAKKVSVNEPLKLYFHTTNITTNYP